MNRKALVNRIDRFLDSKYAFLFYAFFFFVFVILYNNWFIDPINKWVVDPATYTQHLVDYSFGFCTKFLPGAIYHLFFKEVYEDQLNAYLTVLILIFFAALSIFLARAVTLQKSGKEKLILLVFIMFYLSGPSTFAIYIEEFGMMDTYWIFFAVLFFAFIRNEYLKFLTPVFVALTLLVHFSSVATYVILFALILLYEACKSEKKKNRIGYGVIFGFTFVMTAVMFIYFLTTENSNLSYDMNGFNEHLLQRDKSGYNFTTYFNYAFYNDYSNSDVNNPYIWVNPEQLIPVIEGKLSPKISFLFGRVITQFIFNLKLFGISPELIMKLFIAVGTCAPLTVLFFLYWRHKFKEDRGLVKLVYFLAPIQTFVTILAGVLCSADMGRWAGHAFLVQFTLALYIVLREQDLLWFKEKLRSFGYRHILIYYSIYILVYIPAYS